MWAPYSGHCVEKSLATKSKCVDSKKKNKLKKVLFIPFQLCKAFGMVFFFYNCKQGFYVEKPSSHGITQGCFKMLQPSAFI